MCHYKQDGHPACARFFSCSLVLARVATCSSKAGGTFTITVVAVVAPWWKGAAFTEKMNVDHEDEEFVGVRVSGHNQEKSDPPFEFTGTKPSEFKGYREQVRRWISVHAHSSSATRASCLEQADVPSTGCF